MNDQMTGASDADFSDWVNQLRAATEEAEKLKKIISETFASEEASEAYEADKENGFVGALELMKQTFEAAKESDALDYTEAMISALTQYAQQQGYDGNTFIKDMIEMYPQLMSLNDLLGDNADKMNDSEKATQAAAAAFAILGGAIKKIDINKLSDKWEDVNDLLDDYKKNGSKAVKTTNDIVTRVTKLKKAYADYNVVADKTKKGTDEYNTSLKDLAEYTGLDAEYIENNLGDAFQVLQGEASAATYAMNYLLNNLMAVSGSSFNPSNWYSSLQTLASGGNTAAAAVLAIVDAMRAVDGASVTFVETQGGLGGYLSVSGVGKASDLIKTKTGRGGGGGGGGGKSKEESAIQKLLKEMEATMKVIDYRRKMAQLGQEYHELRGEIQGVIMYMDKEIAIIKEQDTTAKQHIETLKKQIASFKGEQEELDDLTEQLEEYNQQVVQNKIDIEELTQAIQEQKDAIREMEIELRETIAQAIQDREDLEESMRDARIEMEDEILAAITERYEKERDLAIETAEAKKEALQEEKNLISEQLRLRKELADEEDKQQELAELEAKLARISADPTRAKDEQKLREEIAKLREEIAWDIADKEAKAQQDAIDQQIESIDDYIEYVNNYYEELFEHPTRLINEMKEVMKLTDAEIIEWLAANSSEYQASSETMQESMRIGWQNTLDAVKGAIKTHWEEVEYIISQGDEYIINFLKENSADYKEAGKLQAEAYVDEWKKQLADLEAAYRKITGEIADTTAVSTKGATVTGSSGSGGGGGGGGGTGKY